MKTKKIIRAAIISIGLPAVVTISYYYGITRGEAIGFDKGESAGYSQGYFNGFKKGRTIGHRKVIDNLYRSLGVLKIKNLPAVQYDAVFSKHHLLQAGIKLIIRTNTRVVIIIFNILTNLKTFSSISFINI